MAHHETQEKLQFHELELDQRILKAIAQLGWVQPTLIQSTAIPLLLDGNDVVVRARTGSGKTAAYALPLIQKILNSKLNASEQCVSALVLAPTKELCRQSRLVVEQLAESCGKVIRVADIAGSSNDMATQRHALAERPDIVVATPSKILAHVEAGTGIVDLQQIETLVVDEADMIFAFGYEKDFKRLMKHLPPIYQAILVSATITDDVVRMKGLCLKNAITLKLEEPELVSLEQLTHQRILAEENDKPAILCALLKLTLIQGKSIIFVNTVDRCYKVRLFLEQFGIRSCVLNSELPANMRIHTISQFNRGTYDIIIASDEHILEKPAGKTQRKSQHSDHESSTSRGIDFQGVNNVINFDFPRDVTSYIHRAGRTARGNNKGSVLSFVSVKELPINLAVEEKLRSTFGRETLHKKDNAVTLPSSSSSDDNKKADNSKTVEQLKRSFANSLERPQEDIVDDIIKIYQFKMEEVEAFRYRAQDCWRAATRVAVHDTRIREIKTEILNCEKLKGFFEENKRDLQALRHDKPSRTIKVHSHLAHVPEYILPKALKRVAIGPPPTHTAYKQARTTGAKAAFQRQSNDPLMVSEVDYGKRRGRPKSKRAK
ncbi:probable ATP-dependent RNA helicase DDX56 [Drosophila grimshawi]|uniref:RNA helicase n=1 Tax=Drosophila grimshawi TaxID=7222 RepID=B4JMR6_DROGR|nr:probable ATP-dependent RNA helicase DDX56 [Drosophila grimshawi]EDV92009.1 GH24281 [Drosophila grimshawi]